MEMDFSTTSLKLVRGLFPILRSELSLVQDFDVG